MSVTSEYVQFWREGSIAHVRLNRPSKLNAITDCMEQALLSVWTAIDDDDEISCAILSGSGDSAFCVGADVSGEHSGAGIAFGGGLTGVGGPLVELRKPLIAAVQGYCLGGGFELALCADILIASDDAVFGLPETRAGIIDHCGVVHRVVRRLPYAVAMGLVLADRRLTAADAVHFGIANSVVSPNLLAKEAQSWAQHVAASLPGIAIAAKAAAKEGLSMPLASALSRRYEEIDRYLASQ